MRTTERRAAAGTGRTRSPHPPARIGACTASWHLRPARTPVPGAVRSAFPPGGPSLRGPSRARGAPAPRAPRRADRRAASEAPVTFRPSSA